MTETPSPATADEVLAALREEILTGSDATATDHDGQEPEGVQDHDLVVVDGLLSGPARAALAQSRGPAPHAGLRARESMTAGLDRGLQEHALDSAPLQVVLAEHRIRAGVARDALALVLRLPVHELAAAERGETPLSACTPATTAAWIGAVGVRHDTAVTALRRSLLREHAARPLAPAAGDGPRPQAPDPEGYVAEVARLLDADGSGPTS